MKHPIQTEENFDFRRHFGEFFRHVFPIMVMVFAAALIAYVMWGPAPKDPAGGINDGPAPRIGLLPAEKPGTSGLAEEPDAEESPLPFDPAFVVPRPLDLAKAPRASRFDAPMGSPLGALTYNAQPFLTTRHLGDDLNGIGGWDSDLGDAIYAAGDGEVTFAGWPSDGWGNVIQILHRLPNGETVTTFYGHLKTINVPVGGLVRRGDRVGTVGKADGRYLAHLHFEVRPASSLNPGAGYADGPLGRRAGEPFIAAQRGAPKYQQNRPLGGDWDTRLPGTPVPNSSEGPSMQIKTEGDESP